MIDLINFFDPVNINFDKTFLQNSEDVLLNTTHIHKNSKLLSNQSLSNKADVVLFALPNIKNNSKKFITGVNAIRRKLYGLRKLKKNITFYDLGNFKLPSTPQNFEAGIKIVFETLFEANIRIILIGESFLPIAIAKTLSDYYQDPSVLMVNNHFENFEQYEIITQTTEISLNFGLLGFQNYLTSQTQIEQGEKQFMEFVRLADIKNKIHESEPYFRDADWASISLNVVADNGCMAMEKPSPNGLLPEEFCAMPYYAGLGCKNKILSFSGYNFQKDRNNHSASLIAQSIWLYLDGFSGYIQEHPSWGGKQNIQRYIVINEEYGKHFIFYKSMLTGRWWMEIPTKNKKNIIVAASYKDYKMASNQQIPPRWWNIFKRYF